MKLYKVTLRGMKYSATGNVYGISYVVAENSEIAYLKVKDFLNTNNYGFSSDREMESIELLAEDNQYSSVNTMLYL